MRLVHITRIFGAGAGASAVSARAAIAGNPAAFAAALRAEAADSDDVMSAESALSYFDDRLTWFGDLIPAEATRAIRKAFLAGIKAWA